MSASERARREGEIDFAGGNVRHEGGIPSHEIEASTPAICRRI
jgi:hypothetical protein